MASTSPQGVLYYESEYSSAEPSIKDFIGLVLDMFETHLSDEVLEMLDYNSMLAASKTLDGASMTIGPLNGQLKLYWTTCDVACAEDISSRN